MEIKFRGVKKSDKTTIVGNLSTNKSGSVNVISQITEASPVCNGRFEGWCFAVEKNSVEQLVDGIWTKCYK